MIQRASIRPGRAVDCSFEIVMEIVPPDERVPDLDPTFSYQKLPLILLRYDSVPRAIEFHRLLLNHTSVREYAALWLRRRCFRRGGRPIAMTRPVKRALNDGKDGPLPTKQRDSDQAKWEVQKLEGIG